MESEDRPLAEAEAEAVNHSVKDPINNDVVRPRASSSHSSRHLRVSRWQKIQQLHNSGWIWECLCWIAVIGALIAMVSIIAAAQDQPMVVWRHNHSNLSINAVIAVLSALLKGTCMFIVAEVIGQSKWQWFGKAHKLRDFKRIDDASRGPWGSAILLCWMQTPTLARLGAFITVVALAVDPFTQNIIATRNCQIPSPNQTAFIPTADVYNGFLSMMSRNANPSPGDFTLWGIDRYIADAAIRASVYSGLYGSATTVINASTIRPNCPGANCTFPRYTTLGVCHQCADISSSVQTVCNSDPPAQEKVYRPRCQWSLPSGQLLQSYAEKEAYFKAMNGTMADFSMNFAIANSTMSNVALPHVPGTFTNVTILANATTDPKCTIYSNNNCKDGMGVPNFEFQTIAVECSLFPCARTYTASVIDGAVVETEVKRSVGKGEWLNDRSWQEILMPDEVRINPDEDCKSDWPYLAGSAPPCTYVAGFNFIMALGNFFWSFWNGTVAGRYYGDAASSNDILEILYGGSVTNLSHIDSVLDGIADSMTAAIRLMGSVHEVDSGSGGGQGNVTGQVMLADTCIDVRWGWIALPAAVALLTLLLLVSTVVLDRMTRELPAWKSSALPILFHGLDTAALAPKGQLLTATEMEKETSRLWVRLTDETSGTMRLETWRWQGVDDNKAP